MAKGRGSFMPSFGVGVGALAVNSCPSTDTSLFCQFQRFFQVFTQVITLIVIFIMIIFFGYYVWMAFFSKRGKGMKNFF